MSNLFFSQGKVLNFERLSLTIEYSLMDFNLPLTEVGILCYLGKGRHHCIILHS